MEIPETKGFIPKGFELGKNRPIQLTQCCMDTTGMKLHIFV